MAIQTKRKTIDGVEYQVIQLGAKEGRAVLVRLTKMLGPLIAGVAGAAKGGIENLMDLDVANLAPVLEKAARDLNEADLDYLCTTFGARACYREGKDWPELDRHFDEHFAGAYVRMFKWLAFAIEVNYADFFDAFKKAKAKAEAAAAAKAQPSESPTA